MLSSLILRPLRRACVLGLGIGLAGFGPGGARAVAASGDPTLATMNPLERAEFSMRLYLLGLEEERPLAIIAAAEIRKEMTFAPGSGPAKAEGSGLDILPGGHMADPLDWEAMLEAARDLAGDNVRLLDAIEDVAAESTKGVATGQLYSISEIADGGADVYSRLPFEAGEYAEVYIEGAAGADLSLFIYDAAGLLVCADTDPSPISYCAWRPSVAGDFTIRVENRGTGAAGYALMTN